MTEPSASPTQRVGEAAAVLGLDVTFIARPPADSLTAAAAALHIEPGDIIKTLVVKRSDDTFVFALIPGDRVISWPKLRAAVGVNKLQLPPATVALAATGYERGTIVPLGSTHPWPVFADERIRNRRVALGAGAHGYSMFVDANALLPALSATVADISTEAPAAC
ncbi:Cys-tRNA(Pro) deacylase [Microbacterium endophyticum]|uniref:Cys-tRNA(Pro) deacylase n=1 Tax=Microbacterium endophyticum TaxID=1526412 RepID=A0A7W4YNU1_9MICO|nr:YbaK/EbsC family protein [Microbacterium endophyticum]MBB2976537.1 Cys-tRNA(Pro) deacylase [Microbacterium endophyticum]NIK35983.1 Cys-tRNA(Pro) deacylase [Microbacterium endophyticum]